MLAAIFLYPVDNQPVFKTLIENGNVIMFLIPVVLVDFHRRFEHVFVSLRHISTHTSIHIKKSLG